MQIAVLKLASPLTSGLSSPSFFHSSDQVQLRGLIAITIVENSFCDFFWNSAGVWGVASSLRTSVPFTYTHSSFASSRRHIWKFQVTQFKPSSLSIDHFSSIVAPVINQALREMPDRSAPSYVMRRPVSLYSSSLLSHNLLSSSCAAWAHNLLVDTQV